MDCPELMSPKNMPLTSQLFQPDVIERAQRYLDALGGSTGAYSHSKGMHGLIS